MKQLQQTSRLGESWSHGFTLMEILITMGIFLIGVVAIAAVFPTGVSVQREAVDDLRTQAVFDEAAGKMIAIAQEKNIATNSPTLGYLHTASPRTIAANGTLAPYTVLATAPEGGDRVYSLTNIGTGTGAITSPNNFNPTLATSVFPESIRSYPSHLPVDERDYYWYPFIKASEEAIGNDPTETVLWRAYAIILKRSPLSPPPQVRQMRASPDPNSSVRIVFDDPFPNVAPFNTGENDADGDGLPDLIRPGDWVLGNDDLIYRVILADNDGITVDAAVVDPKNKLSLIFYGVNVDDSAPPNVTIGTRSPVVRIDEFLIPIQEGP